jgi:hypothetical protein
LVCLVGSVLVVADNDDDPLVFGTVVSRELTHEIDSLDVVAVGMENRDIDGFSDVRRIRGGNGSSFIALYAPLPAKAAATTAAIFSPGDLPVLREIGLASLARSPGASATCLLAADDGLRRTGDLLTSPIAALVAIRKGDALLASTLRLDGGVTDLHTNASESDECAESGGSEITPESATMLDTAAAAVI